MSINTAAYYSKLVNHEQFTEDEIVALITEIRVLRQTAAFLASCQAATMEGLPKSASKSSVARHISICQAAAGALAGDMSGIRYPQLVEDAIERCRKAAQRSVN